MSTTQPRTKAWYASVTKITHRWYRVMKYYQRKQEYWRGRLYKYRAGSYRWRRAWNYYRSYNYRVVRWGRWYTGFLRHLRRYWKSGTSGWKKVNSSVERWKAFNKRYRAQWRHRLAFWATKLQKSNADGKAYKRVERRQAAATAQQAFRQTYKSWYYAMYYSYRSKYDSSTFKQYYPQVTKLNGDVLKFYVDRANYYKGQMDKYKPRSSSYRVYFRYYMIYKYRILHLHYYNVWFDKKMYHRFRKNTAEYKEMGKLLHSAHKDLKADFIIANPPFNISDWSRDESDVRWKYGVPPSLGMVRTWKALPVEVENKLPVMLPRTTPLLAKLDAPVPPLLTPRTPDPIIDAGSFGMSEGIKVVPAVTRPFASTVTLAY